MKMRKLLAVVLAVTLAISAMAISVFADGTVTIPMYNNYTAETTNITNYTITVPVYGTYGYLTAGSTITLNLPLDPSGAGLGADYSLTVNGVTVDLQDPYENSMTYVDSEGNVYEAYADANSSTGYVDGSGDEVAAPEYYQQVVEVGYAARDYSGYMWLNDTLTEVCAMIPQSTAVASYTTITINAEVDWSAYSSDPTTDSWNVFGWWLANGQALIAVIESADANFGTTEVYGYQLSTTKTTGSEAFTDNVLLIADVTEDQTVVSAGADNTILYWDHTLNNRSTILSAQASGAEVKLVVELAGTISGYAVYTLTTNAEAIDSSYTYADQSLWATSSSSITSSLYGAVADTYVLNGNSTDTLEFSIDPDLLYNSTYGVYNGTMYITQLLTGTGSSVGGTYYTNSYDTDNDSSADVFTLEATDVYLEITFASDDEVVDTDEPVEEGDTKTEDDGEDADSVDVGDVDETPDETNPTTGIVLALVPMAVAAAAAVASKRR